MKSFDVGARVFVAGHNGLIGSAIVRLLKAKGFRDVITADRDVLDLRRADSVEQWFKENQPAYVFHAAGTGGGILANATTPADFLTDNLLINASIINSAARTSSVRKLLYICPATVYPRVAHGPMSEASILESPLELTNRPYAIAKLTGLELCRTMRLQYGRNFVSAVVTNTYGPNDNFDLDVCNVIPGIIRRMVEARDRGENAVQVWGTGEPVRDFMHSDDVADAAFFLMDNYDAHDHINVAAGNPVTIAELASLAAEIVHPSALTSFDSTKPDGTPSIVLDGSRLAAMGWSPSVSLSEGLRQVAGWYEQHMAEWAATANDG